MALQPASKKTPAAAWQQQQLLPDEVMEEIFTRLPARSAARCRCLSRSWAAVLSSRGFINRHLDLARSSPSRRRCFLFQYQESRLLPRKRLTRSCRGLVLAKNYSTGLHYVCNPSTGQAASLPHGTPVKTEGAGAWDVYVSFGLGHDARAERHKVVRLYYPAGGLPAGCEVYDVGVGSKGYWRPAASGARPPCFALYSPDRSKANGVFAQGRLHWLATSRRGGQPPDSVMSLSLADETFTCVPLPPRACGRSSLGLTVLRGGRLGLVSSVYRARPRAIWTPEDRAWRHNPADPPQQLWSQLATVVGSGYDRADDYLYEESLEPVGRPYEDVLFAPTSHLHALSMALRRLPARTLGRLKSVCRSWRAVIESDRFASAHNEHHRRSPPSSSLADRVVFTSCPPREGEPAVPLRSCLPWAAFMEPPPLTDRRVVVSKPCHGVAQVVIRRCRGWEDRTLLLNPATGAHRTFSFADHDVDCRSLDVSSGSIGLGYDESTQEHVLVLLAADTDCKAWRLRADDDGIGIGIPRARTTVPAPPITPRFLPSASAVPPVHVDGRIHWMCCSPRAILAFCVRAGAFHVVPAPPPPGPGTGTEFLVELRRQLCVVQSCPRTETVTIWSAAGDDGAWSREHVIELGRWPEFSPKKVELVVPMGIEPTDGRILLDTGSSLGYYDPARRTMETLCSVYEPTGGRILLHAGLGHYDDDPVPSWKVKRFFAAALWEESLVRPYDRCFRSWR